MNGFKYDFPSSSGEFQQFGANKPLSDTERARRADAAMAAGPALRKAASAPFNRATPIRPIAPGQHAERLFGVVDVLHTDGSATIRRLDGRGSVLLDTIGAQRVGGRLAPGTRVEFEIGRHEDGIGAVVARYAALLDHGAPRLNRPYGRSM